MAGSGYALWASHVIFKSCGLTQPMANVVLLGGAKNRNRYVMVVQVVEVSSGGARSERFLPKNQHKYLKKIVEV